MISSQNWIRLFSFSFDKTRCFLTSSSIVIQFLTQFYSLYKMTNDYLDLKMINPEKKVIALLKESNIKRPP